MKAIKLFLILLVSIFFCTVVNAQGIKIYQKNGEILNLFYADIDSIVAYGDTINNNDKYEAVDLGLSVKWATFNVGATTPEEYGDYFAWGETSPKETYTKENSLTYEMNIGDISGNPEYDAATANWGGSWRMPTETEMQELCENCTWEWTMQNGVNGYKLTSNKNGNYIFLPAAGYRNESSLKLDGKNGYYWSSASYEKIKNNTFYLLFYSGYNKPMWNYRRYGYSVRPVTE